MKTFFILVLLISGCANNQTILSPSNQYGQTNMPLAESGKIKWSDYYLGMYEKLLTESGTNTGNQLIIFNDLIDTAKAYEAGLITKDKFESKRREARGKLKQLEINTQVENEPSIFSAPQPPANTPRQSTTCTSSGGQIFCTTY